MPILLIWLGQAITWISGTFLARWVATKVLIISVLIIVLPWVLKDVLQWFWKVSEIYRSEMQQFVNDQIISILGQAGLNATLTITSVAGYISNQIGLIDYATILFSGFALCWSLKFIGKIL